MTAPKVHLSEKTKTLSWELKDGTIELALHHPPCNEMGTAMLEDLEQFVATLESAEGKAGALIVYSGQEAGFSAGADLRELYAASLGLTAAERVSGVRTFLERMHRVLNAIDASPLTTIAAVHGVTFGGGFELALACDLIIADKMARFCFPELRLGLSERAARTIAYEVFEKLGFGAVAVTDTTRVLAFVGAGDLLLTGRGINAAKAMAAGLVSQVAGEGEALQVARATAAQAGKFNRTTSAAAKRFLKPIPHEELRREIDLFCELFERSAVMEGLRKFVEHTGAHPYLP